MGIEIRVPDIGTDEVEVTEIMVKPGDKISKEQALIMVEGDKASMEVPSVQAGIVKEIKIALGDKISTGSLIMIFDSVEGAAVASPSSEPANTSEPAEKSALPSSALPSPGINQTADTSYHARDTVTKTPAPSASIVSKSEFSDDSAYTHATPVIRRLAREFGISLANIKGTGPKARILREDVQSYVKAAMKVAESAKSGSGFTGMLPWPDVDFRKFGATEEVELGRIQKISGANLSRNWVIIPHVTQFDEADITDAEAFRKQQNIEAEQKKLNVKITPLVFLMKAAAQALEVFPRFNSSLLANAQTLILKKYIHIGVAVDTPNGLVVPVFRDVNKKGIIELSHELALISRKAREGKLQSSDMQGGCFTISSLGGIGGTAFTPIVNAPEVAILGVSKSSMKPIWNGKEFVPRLMLPLSLSYDHRVIDGAAGARFVSHIGILMADIHRLLM